MVARQPIPTIFGYSRLRIKTHTAIGVGMGVHNGDILPKKPQISDFKKGGTIGAFYGVFRIGKLAIGAQHGVILLWREQGFYRFRDFF